MQIQKENIRNSILIEAEKLFVEHGYRNVSMRDLAKNSKISLSNIYNYFSNKNELYIEILTPVIKELESFINYHKHENSKLSDMNNSKKIKENIEIYVDLITNNRNQLRLLLLKSQGSSLEQFKEEYTNKMTEVVLDMFRKFKREDSKLNINISPFFIHLNTTWMFSIIEEMVMHDLSKEETQKFITEYMVYETAGWSKLMGL